MKPGTCFINTYSYKATLRNGNNTFEIIATNKIGMVKKTLTVSLTSANDNEIDGQASVLPFGLTVTNTSGKVWGQCTIQLNDTLTSTPYKAQLSNLAMSSDTSASSPNYIPFSSFSKSNGTRFNHTTTKVTSSTVTRYDSVGKLGSMSFSGE